MKKIYLAGFDVFYDDAIERGIKMKNICSQYGFVGLYPLDNKADTAKDIFNADVDQIDQCDIVVANLNDFRGTDMDSGTAFELGYGYAKHKKLFGYMSNTDSLVKELGIVDKNGFNVENFGLPINLMIGVPVTIVKGNLEDCIKHVSNSKMKY